MIEYYESAHVRTLILEFLQRQAQSSGGVCKIWTYIYALLYICIISFNSYGWLWRNPPYKIISICQMWVQKQCSVNENVEGWVSMCTSYPSSRTKNYTFTPPISWKTSNIKNIIFNRLTSVKNLVSHHISIHLR